MESFHELSKKKKDQEAYACSRMLPVMHAFSEQLYLKEKTILEDLKKEELFDLYETIEKPLIPILFKMEKEGIITGYHASVDPMKLGYHILAFIHLDVIPADKPKFYAYAAEVPNVLECCCVTRTVSRTP